MKKLLLCLFITILPVFAFAQNNRIWIHANGDLNYNPNPKDLIAFDNPRKLDERRSFRVDLEKNIYQKQDYFSIGLSATYMKYSDFKKYQFGGAGGFSGSSFAIGGGGISLRKNVISIQHVQFWISNTTTLLHMNHKETILIGYKVKWKNFMENKITLENVFKLKNKKRLALGLNYNYFWDIKYPEEYKESEFILTSPFFISLGFQF